MTQIISIIQGPRDSAAITHSKALLFRQRQNGAFGKKDVQDVLPSYAFTDNKQLQPGVLQSPLRLEISVHANFKDSEVCCARAHGSGMVIDLKTTVLFMPT